MRAFDVVYFAASVDDADTNKKFAEHVEADYAILADPSKKVAEAYGVVTAERALASRWTYYIDPNGKILYIDKQVKTSTAGEDVVARLAALEVKKK